VASIVRSRGLALVAGDSPPANSLVALLAMTSFLEAQRLALALYARCRAGLPVSSAAVRRLSKRLYAVHLRSFEEQYQLVNALPVILSADYYRQRPLMVVFDDFVSNYFASPVSRHRVAGVSLVAEQLAVMKSLAATHDLRAVLTTYLGRDGRPLLWRVFSRYVDRAVAVRLASGSLELARVEPGGALGEAYSINLNEVVRRLEVEEH